MWIDKMLDPLCDLELWPSIFMIKFWKTISADHIPGIGGKIDMDKRDVNSHVYRIPVPQISINSPYSKSGKSYGWEYWDSAFCGKKRRKREKIIMEKKRRKKRKFSPYSFPLFLHIIGSIETPHFMEESGEKADLFSIFISAFSP